MDAKNPCAAPLTAHLGYWLRQVSNHTSHAFASKLQAEGVTVAEWAILRSLYDEEAIAPSRLADRMGLTRGAISKLADRLLAKKLLQRGEAALDGGMQTLRLTSAGRALVPRLAALGNVNDAEVFDALTVEDRANLERILRILAQRRGLSVTPVS